MYACKLNTRMLLRGNFMIQTTICPIIFSLFLVVGCQNNNKSLAQQSDTATTAPAATPAYYTDIKIDSILAIPLGKPMYCYQQGFIFSPFDKHKVWVCPENEKAFELDLDNGRKISFSEKFGSPMFARPMRASEIYCDAFDPKVCWFLSFHEGVFRFNQAKGNGQFFDVRTPRNAVSTLCFSKDYVWIGTSGGLWCYDRYTGTCRAVDNSPETWISQIQVMPDGKVAVIGDGVPYTYDPEARCWTKQADCSDASYAGEPNPLDNLYLPSLGGNYATATAPGETWFCNANYWFVRPNAGTEFQTFRPVLSVPVTSMLADSDNLYLLLHDNFLIVNKKYLYQHQAGDPHLYQKIEYLRRLADSLHLNVQESWSERKAKIAVLNTYFPGETDPYLLSEINRYADLFTLPDDEKNLLDLLSKPDADTVVWSKAYVYLMRHYVQAGALRQAAALENTCQKTHDNLRGFQETRPKMAAIEFTLRQLDSIDRSGPAEDERLWRYGIALQGFCVNQQFISSEVCYSYWLADSLFRQLSNLYPQSAWADDAAYQLIMNSQCNEGEDGSNHPEIVKAWKKFLRQYPDTDKRPEVLCDMTWALDRSPADLRQGLQWLAEAEQLRPDWFLKHHQGIKLDFQRQLDAFELNFTLQLKKTSVRVGEPVEVVFSLQNTATAPKKLQGFVDARFPNFSLEVTPETTEGSCVMPVTYLESQTSAHPQAEKFYGKKIIKGRQAYLETWDITQTAHKINNPNIGRFVFDRPGVYILKAHSDFWYLEKTSEGVRLEVQP
jgi:hypothetical protein